jgi:hypothetical protein
MEKQARGEDRLFGRQELMPRSEYDGNPGGTEIVYKPLPRPRDAAPALEPADELIDVDPLDVTDSADDLTAIEPSHESLEAEPNEKTSYLVGPRGEYPRQQRHPRRMQ